MKIIKPTILVIVGISGDLAKRKLLPAISQMSIAGVLPTDFKILGITRQTDIDIPGLFAFAEDSKYLEANLDLFSMDLLLLEDYEKLALKLQETEKNFSAPAQYLFYLSIPPQVSRPIIESIGKSSLAKKADLKLLLEKPFGVDLDSATELASHIDKYFKADQVYRIDHYLAKETVQNLLVFRADNSLFKQTWNQKFISRIEIIASESLGIEGRADFYEQTGALRDLVQSHLLQLAALTLMDSCSDNCLGDVPACRLKALKNLYLPTDKPLTDYVKRGQYVGYQDEVKNSGSAVETFVSVTLSSKDPNWAGVPIVLSTGKALAEKFTGIKISYKKDKDNEANELILKLQPDEGVELGLWTKSPGYEYEVIKKSLRFNFAEHYLKLPEAYEQVLFNAINSDHSLFTSSAEVLETWRILNVIQTAWEMSADDLIYYQSGSDISQVLNL
ncbi:MAG: hypothetical protein WCK59_01390 [Candidatus Falkowbacteria bacterium]